MYTAGKQCYMYTAGKQCYVYTAGKQCYVYTAGKQCYVYTAAWTSSYYYLLNPAQKVFKIQNSVRHHLSTSFATV